MARKFVCPHPELCQAPGAICRSEAFGRLRALPGGVHGTRIEWELRDTFRGKTPHVFTLLVGRTGIANADDWEPVGLPVTGAEFLLDDVARDTGRHVVTHYMVHLETADNREYYSDPIPLHGDLDFRSWRLIQSLWNSEQRRMETTPAGTPVWILKRRRYGPFCPDCTSIVTREVQDPHCLSCYGVGITGGYQLSGDCHWAEIRPISQEESQDPRRGPIDEKKATGSRFIASMQLDCQDVVIAQNTGIRYLVRSIENAAEMRTIPLIYDPVVLQVIPFSSVIHAYDIQAQREALGYA